MNSVIKKYTKIKILKSLGILLCIFGFFIIANTSHAQAGLMSLAGKSIIDIISWGIMIVLYILSTLFASVLMIGGWVFDWTLNLNSAILSNPAVRVGWPIARDITNLGFILVMLIIAFSTILRMGEFTAKKALPRLIIAALLINFSLLFVGIFLDFTNIITNFFINQGITGAGNGVGISQAIIGMMNVVSYLKPPDTFGGESLVTFGAGMLTFIANLFFINIITAVTAITMWAMAIMFLIRYVYLGLLIIILPLAILAYVLGRGEWTKWLDAFVAKSLFAPIASLFIYLAIATAQEFGAMQISAQQASAAPGLSGITANIGSMIMIVSILLFGLGLAESISGIGGGLASKIAKGAATGILKGGLSTAMSPLNMKFGKSQKGLMDRASEWGKNNKYGVVRGLTRPLRQVGVSGKEFQKQWGGGTGIMSGVLSGIDEGMGGKGRALREKEEAQYKQRKDKFDKLSARLSAAKGISLAEAQQEVETKFNEHTAINPETALEETNKSITRDVDTKLAMSELTRDFTAPELLAAGITDEASFKAVIASNAGDINNAKRLVTLKAGKDKKKSVLDNEILTSDNNIATATASVTATQAKLNQHQLDLSSATRNLASLNPAQLKTLTDKINQDIAKAQQDIADAQKTIVEENKNKAQTQKAINLL